MSEANVDNMPVDELIEGADRDFRELPFVIRTPGGDHSEQWCPPDVSGVSETQSYVIECNFGRDCAVDLLAYMREWGPKGADVTGSLLALAKQMVERGKWGHAEIGFFDAIEQWIVNREIYVNPRSTIRIDS